MGCVALLELHVRTPDVPNLLLKALELDWVIVSHKDAWNELVAFLLIITVDLDLKAIIGFNDLRVWLLIIHSTLIEMNVIASVLLVSINDLDVSKAVLWSQLGVNVLDTKNCLLWHELLCSGVEHHVIVVVLDAFGGNLLGDSTLETVIELNLSSEWVFDSLLGHLGGPLRHLGNMWLLLGFWLWNLVKLLKLAIITDHEPEVESGTDTKFRVDSDVTIEELADLLADMESEADALLVESILLLELTEKAEQFLLVLLANTIAVVLD